MDGMKVTKMGFYDSLLAAAIIRRVSEKRDQEREDLANKIVKGVVDAWNRGQK